MANKNLFLKLAEVFNGNQEIERFASQELIANAHTPLVLGSGAITEFNLDYLYGPEPEVSGE